MSWHKYNTRFFNYDSTDMLIGASRHRLLKPLHWVYALSYNEGPISYKYETDGLTAIHSHLIRKSHFTDRKQSTIFVSKII